MSTNTAANSPDNTRSTDFDGFVSEPPYCYGWTTNANGVKVPVFPYVISVLGHLNLTKIGVKPEDQEHATQLMKDTLELYLEQVITQWQAKRYFWEKNSDFPLIILINIADKIGELITDVVEKLQEKYPFVRLIAVLPMPKDEFVQQLKAEEEDDEKIQAFETRYEEFKRDDTNDQKYIWELSEREMPHMAKQTKLKKWRMFNEFVAQHSHLMIVFWQGKEDKWKHQDDSLTWAVRYKLEGYPGLSRHEQNDLITYPATGPVLHIQTDVETFQNSKDFLPVRFYSDRAIITKEVNEKRELIITDPKFWDLEQLRHTWFSRKLSNIGLRSEIDKNLKILKDLNYACQDKNIPLENQPIRSYIEDYVNTRYQRSQKPINVKIIPDPDMPTGQLIAHYNILDKISKYYKKKTYQLINLFCGTFLILLVFNALLVYLNDISSMGYGKNVFELCNSRAEDCLPAQTKQVESDSLELLAASVGQAVPPILSEDNKNIQIESQTKNITRITIAFWGIFFCISLCIITVFYCCISSMRNSWHYKYHQFKTLSDCIRVQVFWKIAGMDYSVCANFRSHQIPAMDWLLMALNGLNITVPNSEKVESTQKLKDRIKMLDTIWIEDRIQSFEAKFQMDSSQIRWNSLTPLSKLTAFVVASLIPFLAAFFAFDFGFPYHFCGSGLDSEKSFSQSIIFAAIVTIFLWIVIYVWFFVKSKQNWLIKHLKWSQIYYTGPYGFLGSIYRKIKFKRNLKHYFLVPNRTRIFHACIIIVACFGAFFEIKRSNLICSAVQQHNFEYLYNNVIASRLIIQITLSAMAICWLFNRMCLFTKDRRRIEQLYYPFTMADYSIDMMMGDDKAVENINDGRKNQVTSWFDLTPALSSQLSTNPDDEDKVEHCQRVLLELGQEVLAKRADWLLAVSDRNLQSPK